VLAHVANFRPMKRQALALETTARLREALGDVRVVFAGAGPELEAIRALAAERGADWAVFLGAQRNIASVFTMADVAILPSSDEALPMALLEGMAVGVPVVATDVGDVAEVIERTGAGVCVPPEDHDAFYAAVHRILADQAVHRHFAAAAEAAQDELDAARMVGRYERVFDGVLDHGPESAALPHVAALADHAVLQRREGQ
jgi:L-malate glycosyltransferase